MYTNKLVHEKSPYLLQHAHNPVDWHPWGEEAFEKARTESKPIFLSVGYSTCHWCHVMERESFEDEAVARFLNERFVSIKVDREERPDVDRIYMAFVQATTGGGGWPMSVWLTPDLKPFYGGTYFPPVDGYGRPAFSTVLGRLSQAWREDRDAVLEASDKVVKQLNEHLARNATRGVRPDHGDVENCFFNFRRVFDSKHGGFGNAPKFPRPVTFNYLLRWHAKNGNEEALEMTLKTLREMANGGMNDQLGGGFHRYSVDERWFVPHFEKMLYDQGQLAVSYLEAYQLSGDDFFAGVARDVFEYVLRDMTSPDGAFYSAEDADSVIDPADPKHKGEGAFYIWSHSELVELLGAETAAWFSHRCGVREGGNVDHDPQGEFTGKNILFAANSVESVAEKFGQPVEQIRSALDEARAKLLEARGKRVRPHLDDKVLTAWNGLMISAFSKGSQVLGEERYLQAARQAADFILDRMLDADTGTLLRRHRDGEGAIEGFLDDYAFLIAALVDLYEASFERRYLRAADQLAGQMLARFEDQDKGGFFSTTAGSSDLLLRLKDDYDGAEPSGNSAAMHGLLRLAQLTGREEYREAAERAIEALSQTIRSGPATVPQMIVALDWILSTPKQIVLAGERGDPDLEKLARQARQRFYPHRVILLADHETREELADTLPALRDMTPVDGQAAAYICENFTCQLPTREFGTLPPFPVSSRAGRD
jgi:uncharacterized protein YyaL (SSP411 family)